MALLLLIPVIILCIWLGLNVQAMLVESGLHLWPSITSCRFCEKRIFVWQLHERRNFRVNLDNPNNLAVSVGMSGIIHKNCPGVPNTSVSVNSTP